MRFSGTSRSMVASEIVFQRGTTDRDKKASQKAWRQPRAPAAGGMSAIEFEQP
jgi:hypothetical protein